jgi:hypothetical protein
MWTEFFMTFTAVYLALAIYQLMDTFIKGVIYNNDEKRKKKVRS